MRTKGKTVMKHRHLALFLIVSSLLLSACGARTEEGGGSAQPVFNANGELVSGGDGTAPLLGAANPVGELKLTVISDVVTNDSGEAVSANITALVSDVNNNAVPNADVVFSSTGGILQGIAPTTDDNGEATASLRLPSDFQDQDITVTVSAGNFEADVKVVAPASTLGGANSQVLKLHVTSEVEGTLTDGFDYASIVALISDVNNNAVAGTDVSFSASSGVLQNISPQTDDDGEATASLRLPADFPDQDITVTVSAGEYQSVVRVTAPTNTPDEAGATVLKLSVVSEVNGKASDGSDVASITALVSDINNNAVPATNVAFSSTAGVLQNITPVTDANGEATATLKLPAGYEDQGIVVAVSSGQFQSNVIVTAPNNALDATGSDQLNLMVVSVVDDTAADGIDIATITALVADINNNAVGNAEVLFTSTGGFLQDITPTTDANGQATARLRLPQNYEDQNIVVTVSSGEFRSTVTVTPPSSLVDGTQDLNLRVISDVNSIATGGTDIATITALVTNINNNSVADTALTFSSTGGVLQNISPVTDANGEASATLKLPQDFQNQDIMITVSSGEFSAEVKVTASGSTLEVTGPDSLVSGDSAQLVVRLAAGNGEPIANQPVTVSSVAGNSILPAELITDADGRLEITVGSENSSDTVRLSALNGSVSATHMFDVVEDLLSFTDVVTGDEFDVGSDTEIGVSWVSQGLPVIGQQLSFSTTAGQIVTPSTVTTDNQGNATIRVSSDSAGPARITVEATQGGSPETGIDIEFVATEPSTVTIDASVSLISINETSTITALVKDALGNPVKNQEVSFTGEDLKGGQLNPASAVTNSAGIASVTFTAGARATEEDEIQIDASVKGTDPVIEHSMTLTVFKRALNITLGSSNLINVKPLSTQYAIPLVVQVADGSGSPLENATVKLSVRPLAYVKGVYVLVDDQGLTMQEAIAEEITFDPDAWAQRQENILTCPAEDLDGDRILDTLVVDEDINGNGSLDPQDPASLAAVDGGYATLSGGSLRTDTNGSGFLELLYPASNAGWAYLEITARAEALGTEATDTYRAWLTPLASALQNVDISPSNAISPYGFRLPGDEVELRRVTMLDGTEMAVYVGCTRAN